MTIFFDWDKIESAVQPYRDSAMGVLRGGEFFNPHAFAFVAGISAREGIILNVVPTHLRTKMIFDVFMGKVRNPPNMMGRMEAAGFMAMLPYYLAKEYVDVGCVEDPGTLIAVFHIEHVYSGVRTWVVDDPREPSWRVHSAGITTRFPPCFPLSVYSHRGSA